MPNHFIFPKDPNKSKFVMPASKKTINNTICDPSRNIKSRFYTNDSINYLPKILARRGTAELKMTYKPQLRMICVNVVRCAVGRMYLIPGSV